jgi:hypothetical protein
LVVKRRLLGYGVEAPWNNYDCSNAAAFALSFVALQEKHGRFFT